MNLPKNKKWTSELFEAILTVYQNPSYPIVIQCIGIYISPKGNLWHFDAAIWQQMRTPDYDHVISYKGDFNINQLHIPHYNEKLIQHMANKYNLQEYVESNTSYQSKLDLCFSNKTLSTTTIWNHWSDHCIISASVQVLAENILN